MSKSIPAPLRFARLACVALLLASTGVQQVAAQSVPAPSPTRMALAPDAYPHLSGVAANATVLKTAQLASTGRRVVADRLLVKFQPSTNESDRADTHKHIATRLSVAGRPVGQIGPTTYLVDVSGATALEEVARAYRADPRVVGASFDLVGHIQERPNDVDFGAQWPLFQIDAWEAWNRTHGNVGVIAILDTGIDETNPDLAGHVSARHDFIGSASGPTDVNGHGTAVAGIASAATNNGIGVAGVGYGTPLINAKVADDNGQVSLSALVDGINWASSYGANVINMSLGSNGSGIFDDCNATFLEGLLDVGRDALQDAIDDAWNGGAVLVAAAGNQGSSFAEWPAGCNHVLSVANTQPDDTLAPGSSFGSWVSVAAPGTNVWTTGLGNSFVKASGTSMAAPHASGLAALVIASCGFYKQPQYVVDHITETADRIAGTGTNFAWGRINALHAVCFPKPQYVHAGAIGPTSIQILWSETAPGVKRFDILAGPSGTPLPMVGSVDASAPWSYTQTNIPPGAFFDFRVRACDEFGCSDPSAPITVQSNTVPLQVTRVGNGGGVTGPGINCGNGASDCSEVYLNGTVVTLAAHDFSNQRLGIYWAFDHWEGACTGTAPTCTVTMTAARNVRAVFANVS